MRITEKKLRKIIREAMTGSDPKSLYARKEELRKEYQTPFDILDRMGEDAYKEIFDMREQMYAADSSYNGYTKFQPAVKEGHSLFPSAAKKIWDNGMPDPDEVESLFKEYEDLRGQFKSVRASDAVDARYGRKRTNIVHTPTNTVVKSSTDRKGSLGS